MGFREIQQADLCGRGNCRDTSLGPNRRMLRQEDEPLTIVGMDLLLGASGFHLDFGG